MILESDDIKWYVKSMLANQKMTLTEVVKEINKRHPERKETTIQNISNKLSRGTIKFSEIIEIADIIGMEISFCEVSDNTKN